MTSSLKYRLVFSFAISLFTFLWLTAKWHIVADYYGETDCDFVASGFPLPFIVDWGIVARFGNSFDTAISYRNLLLDILFYAALVFGATFTLGKVFKQPSVMLKVTSWGLFVLGVAFCTYVFWMISAGDMHPWFPQGYNIISVEFLNADDIFKNMER